MGNAIDSIVYSSLRKYYIKNYSKPKKCLEHKDKIEINLEKLKDSIIKKEDMIKERKNQINNKSI